MKGQDRKHYRQVTRKIVLVIVGVGLAPLILTGAVLLYQFHQSYREKLTENLAELAQKHSQNIDIFLADRLASIRVLARSYSLAELSDAAFLKRELNILRGEYGGVFVDLGLVDAEGVQRTYAGPFNLSGANYANAEWFQRAKKSEHFISDVFTGLRGTPHFIVAVRQNIEGQDFILRATIDFEAFNALVENLRLGRSGFAFILNRRGEFQTKPRFEVPLDQTPILEFLRGGDQTSRVTIAESKDAGGTKYIFALAPLKGQEWLLCFRQESADAFADLRRAERLAAGIFIVGGLAIVAVALLLSRRMVSRLAETDQQREIMDRTVVETGRLASIGELAAGIAHEINNPVAIMVEEAGWVQDLLADEDPASPQNLEEIKRAVGQIRVQGERCKEITHKLLSFARKTDPTIRQVNINSLIEEILPLLQQKIRYANVQVKTELAKDLPPVVASTAELQQVLLNLANNAVDAIDSGGGQISLKTRSSDGQVVIEVADTGQGIPEANLSRIFDPFFTTKPVGKGTGLGLSICYGIVHKLGGEIEVQSEVGKGSTFTVRLPAACWLERGSDRTEASPKEAR